jgi:hypothetical protein
VGRSIGGKKRRATTRQTGEKARRSRPGKRREKPHTHARAIFIEQPRQSRNIESSPGEDWDAWSGRREEAEEQIWEIKTTDAEC